MVHWHFETEINIHVLLKQVHSIINGANIVTVLLQTSERFIQYQQPMIRNQSAGSSHFKMNNTMPKTKQHHNISV